MSKTKEEPKKPQKLVTEDYIIDVIANEYGKNSKIISIKEEDAFGGGENYASDLLRVLVEFEFEDGKKGDMSYIFKAMKQSEMAIKMIKPMRVLPREILMYTTIIPKLQSLYEKHDKIVTFGPRCLFVRSDEEAFILEDLKRRHFKNMKRQEGLNKNLIELSLKKLAEFHAASAVLYEKEGFPEIIMTSIFTEEMMEQFEPMQKFIFKIYVDCLNEHENLKPYTAKLEKLLAKSMEVFRKEFVTDPNEFNVLNHGDLWCNNIMFSHDQNRIFYNAYFIDYAACRYCTPTQDLWYFLMSSCAPDVKTSKFDHFIKYYHDHLVENLKLLEYSKEIPKLVDLHTSMLKHSCWGLTTVQGVLALALIDPTKLATMENFMDETQAGVELKKMSYSNPRYISALEDILPWMDNKGLLDW